MALPPFQALIDAHGRDVHRFLVATVGRTDADDCYQETWLAALRAYPKLRADSSNLRGWVMTVAHSKAMDHLRRARRSPVPVEEVFDRPLPPTDPDLGEVWAQVGRLPAKQRAAVALRFLADAPYADISTAMGTSEDAARRNVHEGLKRLREEIAR